MLLLAPTVKLQFAPLVQFRLALLLAATVHLLPPLQTPLHEGPQLPSQVPEVQAREQLDVEGSQPILLNDVPPQPATTAAIMIPGINFKRLLLAGWLSIKRSTKQVGFRSRHIRGAQSTPSQACASGCGGWMAARNHPSSRP